MKPTINLLKHLRAKTQVDCDSLDLEVVKKYGPFTDCTSNQADSYFEFLKPQRADLLEKSVAYAKSIHHRFTDVSLQELAVELCMVTVALPVVPLISGSVHIMANPTYSYSIPKIIENAKRISKICALWKPDFDRSRLCIKVPSTWEGLQACRQLKAAGIRTLATTLFSIEQAILAAEVGCVSISPFVHELKVHFDETYHDIDPVFELCVQAQRYCEQYNYQTRVKACSVIDVDEVMQLAGVFAITLPPKLLQSLLETEDSTERVSDLSMFSGNCAIKKGAMERASYLDDQAAYREAFSKNEEGRAEAKTKRAIELFCEYQVKAEAMMKTLM